MTLSDRDELAAEVESLRAEVAAVDQRGAIAVEVTGRRWSAVTDDLRAENETLRDALRLIAGDKCSNLWGGPRCWDEGWGRTRDGDCTAERWCDACIAQDALNRAGSTP